MTSSRGRIFPTHSRGPQAIPSSIKKVDRDKESLPLHIYGS